jgi:uncharacterized protein
MTRNHSRRRQHFLERYGPWAVVTGASSGIGRALASHLAAMGLNLVIVARRRAALEDLAAHLSAEHGVQVRVIDLDLARDDHLPVLSAATEALEVGLLVAAAGFGSSGPLLDADISAETEMLMVNSRAVLHLCHHYGRRFRSQGRGGVVLLSSIVGFQGMPYAAHYAATKAYVQALAEALQVEFSRWGVDVLAAAPGPTRSGFASRAGMRMGQALDPEVIAQPILDALGRQATVLPGSLSKLLVYGLVPLPRWARVRIMGTVMRGMSTSMA